MSTAFFIIAIVSVVWGIVSAIVMVSYVSDRGQKINVFLFRILIIKYISQYYEMTRQENGKPGAWFYSFVIAMNAALLCVIIGASLN